jgi:hypothetical protein
MIDATRALRHFVRLSYRLGGLVQALSTPWLMLGCRLWLGQLLLVQQVMSMMTAAIHTQPDARVWMWFRDGSSSANKPIT